MNDMRVPVLVEHAPSPSAPASPARRASSPSAAGPRIAAVRCALPPHRYAQH
ncbi:type III polyketide synthase, partial [Streptomyces sp. SID5926]|nr:type III polyketide synthase [Streptomyces sp. SID5926]